MRVKSGATSSMSARAARARANLSNGRDGSPRAAMFQKLHDRLDAALDEVRASERSSAK